MLLLAAGAVHKAKNLVEQLLPMLFSQIKLQAEMEDDWVVANYSNKNAPPEALLLLVLLLNKMLGFRC